MAAVRKSRRLLLFLLILVACALGAWQSLRPKEKIYHGRKISAWLKDLINTKGNSKDARTAFREMGSEAIPFLTGVLTNRASVRDRYVQMKSGLNSARLYKLMP